MTHFMIMNHSKKGASPLIATIVLIAFAVSLGGFVMSLGGLYHDKITSGESCEKVVVTFFELKEDEECKQSSRPKYVSTIFKDKESVNPPFCYQENSHMEVSSCEIPEEFYSKKWSLLED